MSSVAELYTLFRAVADEYEKLKDKALFIKGMQESGAYVTMKERFDSLYEFNKTLAQMEEMGKQMNAIAEEMRNA
jgi:hypothetical protein